MQLSDIQAIRRRYDHVYISPHFDDVAASCGGRILIHTQAGKSILVVTIFSSKPNQNTRVRSKALQAMLDYDRRRIEDIEAMQRLGADFLWLEFPEVIFRHHPPWRRYGLTYPVTAPNQCLCCQVTASLKKICQQTQCTEMIIPLGIGQHVDHQIVYQAGVNLQSHKPHPYSVSFYEEIPYALFPFLLIYRLKRTGLWQVITPPAFKRGMGNPKVSAATRAQLLSSLPSLGLDRKFLQPGLYVILKCLDAAAHYLIRPQNVYRGNHPPIAAVTDISTQIDRKLDAISAYTSQLTSPLLTRQNIEKGLAAYAITLGLSEGLFGERYWRT